MDKNQLELTWRQVGQLEPGTWQLADIRDEAAVNYGMIPGAAHVPEEELQARTARLEPGKKLILYCTKGMFSLKWAKKLREDAAGDGQADELQIYSLAGGYTGWLLEQIEAEEAQGRQQGARENLGAEGKTEAQKERSAQEESDEQDAQKPSLLPQEPNPSKEAPTRAQEVEKSLRKRFHKEIFSRFAKAINEYQLVQENDRIAVCISGGKDSMLMAKLFQELKRHNKFPFEVEYLVMDPGYSELNRRLIEANARMLEIPVTIFESDIFEAVYEIEKSPCYLCARMRRGHLYSKAKELGCNKIALGHHYDDVIETILMGMLYGGQVQTMMPKLHSTNFEGMELIRPLYLVREDDIKRWRDYNGLHFIQCACRFTDTCTTCRPDGSSESKRMEVKRLIAQLKKTNPFVESNIFRSVENVNLSTVIAYKEHGVRHHFLDTYDEEK